MSYYFLKILDISFRTITAYSYYKTQLLVNSEIIFSLSLVHSLTSRYNNVHVKTTRGFSEIQLLIKVQTIEFQGINFYTLTARGYYKIRLLIND